MSKEDLKRSECPIACALDVIGDRWSLLILRDALYKGFVGYGEFQSSSECISTNILAARLKKLTEAGIFAKQRDAKHGLKYTYTLTDKGRALEPTIMALGDWGMNWIEGTLDMREKIEQARAAREQKAG